MRENVNFSAIAGIAKKEGKKMLRNINLFDVYENEQQLGEGKKSYAVSFIFEDPSKTLKDKEVDTTAEEQNATRMAPIGEGNMDWRAIVAACEAAGVDWYAVEQDQCYRDPFDCLKSSFEFLAGLES